MSKHTEIAQKSVDAFNSREWDKLASYRTPNSVYDEVSTGRRMRGHSEIMEGMKGWTNAFKDLKGTVTNTMEHGDTVVLEISWKGTHNGPLDTPSGPIPPSGRSVTNRSVQVLRFENDKIAENRHYFDQLNMLRQLGALPSERARKAGA